MPISCFYHCGDNGKLNAPTLFGVCVESGYKQVLNAVSLLFQDKPFSMDDIEGLVDCGRLMVAQGLTEQISHKVRAEPGGHW